MGLLFLMAIGSVLEAFSISLILPLISVVNSPDKIASMHYTAWLQKILGTDDPWELLPWIGGIMLCCYVLKNIFLLFQAYVQNRFIYFQQAKISGELLHYYLHSPYAFHLQRNTAEMIRNLTISMGTIFGSGIIPFMCLAAEAMVVAAIVVLLFLVDPVITVLALVALGLMTGIFYKIVRQRVATYGKKVQNTGTDIFLWANQALGGVKVIKILGRESYFEQAFLKHRMDNARYNINFATIQRMPRLYLEIQLIVGILAVMMVIINRGGELNSSIPIVGIFAMSALRLMPSINIAVNSLNSLKFGSAAVDDIHKDFSTFREGRATGERSEVVRPLSFQKDIQLTGLTYWYPGNNTAVLKDINLTIQKGESVAIVGASGAGKTTLIDILIGLLTPTSGKVEIDGREISLGGQDMIAWQRNIGYVPQTIYLIDDTLRHNIALGIEDDAIDDEQVLKVIRQASLYDLAQTLPEGIDTYIGERGIRLSGGQRQRIGIARALYPNPQVLVMDEATSSLDPETESEISRAIDALSVEKTLLIISHRLSTVKKCKTFYFFKDGNIVDSGSLGELVANNVDFRRMAQLANLDMGD